MRLTKARVRRNFGRSADTYDRVASMQREIIDELATCADSAPGPAIDLGCGTGYGLEVLRQRRGETPIGLDLAAEMLHASKLGSTDAHLIQADIEHLPFADASFALVFSTSALQWCSLTEALAEVARVAKPNGQILMSTFTKGTLDTWHRWWGIDGSTLFVTQQEIETEMALAELTLQRIWCRTYRQRFSCFNSAFDSIRELGASGLGQGQDAGLMGKRRWQSARRQIDKTILEQGYIELPYNVVFVEARR